VPSDFELVTTPEEIRENVYRFNHPSAVDRGRAQMLLSETKYWVADEEENCFGPTKFVGIKDMTFSLYEKLREESNRRPSRFTGGKKGTIGKAIMKVLNSEFTKSPELHALLSEWSKSKFGSDAIKAKTEFIRLRMGERKLPEPKRPTDKSAPPVIAIPSRARELVELFEDAYPRCTREQLLQIVPHHNRLSNRLRAWFAKVGATEIAAECDSVDVSCLHSGQSCLFELKTCHKQSTRHALREALGQILEYAFYPGRPRRERLAIVLDAEPSKSDTAWFRRLVEIGVTVELFWLIENDVYAEPVSDHPLAIHARQR
jgi:hypothetical protein